MRLLAQPREIFDGSKTTCQAKHDVDSHQPAQLQPGEGCPINTHPQCLSDDHICLGKRFPRKATVKEKDNRQNGTGQRHQHEDKESPPRPDVREGFCDQEI